MALADRVAAAPAAPSLEDFDWQAHWSARGQPWRTEREIDTARKTMLAACRAIKPDIAEGIYPFAGVRLLRADIEWLLATHDGGRGPVDWSDTGQHERRGLDLRGADLREAQLGGLPLARTLASLSRDAWFAASPDIRSRASAQLDSANLAQAQLDGALLSGVSLMGASLAAASLTRAQLCAAHLDGAVLRAADLRRADLRRARLDRVNLTRARLDRATLRGATLAGATLAGATADRANLSETALQQADLSMLTARKASFSAACLSGATLFWAHLEGANLSEAQLEGTTLEGAHLRGARLGQAHLEGANLGFADLTNCELAGAHLSGARLYAADLSGADLSGAHLEGCAPEPDQLSALRQWCPEMRAVLPPADLRLAQLSEMTRLDGVCLGEECFGYVLVADTIWDGASLQGVRWATLSQLGDERLARQTSDPGGERKSAPALLDERRAAIRAYDRLAEALSAQGFVADAARLARRAQALRKDSAWREGVQRFRDVRIRAQAAVLSRLLE